MRNNSMHKNMAKPIKTKKDALVAICVALAILLLLDLSPLGGNIVIHVYAVKCGQWPLQSGNILTGGVPNYVSSPKFGLMQGYRQHFCSEKEAEQAGYSADSKNYDFPHLPASEFQDAIKRSQEL